MEHSSKKKIGMEVKSSKKTEIPKIKDIQNEKLIENTPINPDSLLENIFATPHMSIAYMDAKFNFIRVNHSYAKADKHSLDFFVGKNHFDLYPNKENQDIFQKVVKTGKLHTEYANSFEFPFSPDRGITYWDWTLQPIISTSGKTINLILFLVNVTDRIQALEGLRQSEEKYRTLVANIPAVTWITNEYGITTFISPNIKQVYGYTPQEIYEGGEHLWFDRIHPDDVETIKNQYGTLFKGNKKFDVEYRIKRKDGRWIWIHDRAIVVYEQDNEMYGYGIFTDITDRKKADIARNDFERRKTEFMSLASHELRTPLTLVKGYIDVLKKRFNDLSKDERIKCFHITERNILRLEKLISGVNELTKIERGIFSLNTKLIEFNSFLNDTLIAYQDLLGESLTYINPTQNLPCFIEIDSDRIAQVLDNIIQNAINHTARFDRKIVIECDTQMRDVIKIRFRDNGAGIAQENLELIFTPFVSIPSKYSVQGTGIGLFLSKSIIENHNGLIYAESQGLDKGSIFTIELPKKSTYGLS